MRIQIGFSDFYDLISFDLHVWWQLYANTDGYWLNLITRGLMSTVKTPPWAQAYLKPEHLHVSSIIQYDQIWNITDVDNCGTAAALIPDMCKYTK